MNETPKTLQLTKRQSRDIRKIDYLRDSLELRWLFQSITRNLNATRLLIYLTETSAAGGSRNGWIERTRTEFRDGALLTDRGLDKAVAALLRLGLIDVGVLQPDLGLKCYRVNKARVTELYGGNKWE